MKTPPVVSFQVMILQNLPTGAPVWAPSYPDTAGTARAATAPETAETAPDTAATAPISPADVATLAAWLQGRGVLVTSAILGDRVAIEVWNTKGATTARHEYGADGGPLRKNAPKGLTRIMGAAFAALATAGRVAA